MIKFMLLALVLQGSNVVKVSALTAEFDTQSACEVAASALKRAAAEEPTLRVLTACTPKAVATLEAPKRDTARDRMERFMPHGEARKVPM